MRQKMANIQFIFIVPYIHLFIKCWVFPFAHFSFLLYNLCFRLEEDYRYTDIYTGIFAH